MKQRESLFQSALRLTVVGIVTQVVGFVYRMLMSRSIGAEYLGLFHLVMPVYSVMQSIAISGLAVAVSNRSAAYVARREHRAVSQLLRSAFVILFTVCAALSAATLIFDAPLSARVLGDARTALALPCLLPCLLLTGIENVTKHHFYGLGETRIPAAVELAEQVIRAAAVLGLLAYLGPMDGAHTVAVIVLGMGVSEVFSASVLTLARRHREAASPARGTVSLSGREARQELLAFALPIGFTSLLGNLMGAANSVLVPQLLVLAGYTASGAMEAYGVVFGMTLPLLTMPFALTGALSLAVLPRLTSSATLGRTRDVNAYIEQVLFCVSLFVLPLTALIVTLGGGWGELLFHDSRVGDLLLPLCLGTGLSAYEILLSTTLNGIGRQSQGAAISLFCGAVQLGCTLLLTGRMGFYAYALGTAVSSALGVWLRIRVTHQETRFAPDWFSLFLAPVLATLLMGSAVSLLYRTLTGNGWGMSAASAACACIGCALYLIALLAQGVHPVRMLRHHRESQL